ncbi:MAG: phosphoribosylanthranilate isomerase [Chloroflexi bacterium]|nr:phosphoribosylanthranilate isomerase [Chloroflexota bacterium]
MVRVKICGITSADDALAAVEFGADALGFVFAPSPRQVTPEQAARIVAMLPPFVCTVGVFVDRDVAGVEAVMKLCHLDLAQLHGEETPADCRALAPRVIKSFAVRDESVLAALPGYRVAAYLLDTHHAVLKGGTGRTFDWSIARRAAACGPVIISGGLTASNVGQAIAIGRPCAVDVASGVESRPGVKDHARLKAFIEAAKSSPVPSGTD